jgi:hypothetical protein
MALICLFLMCQILHLSSPPGLITFGSINNVTLALKNIIYGCKKLLAVDCTTTNFFNVSICNISCVNLMNSNNHFTLSLDYGV